MQLEEAAANEEEKKFRDFKITKAVLEFNNTIGLKVESFDNEDEFWQSYPNSEAPKVQSFLSIIPNELDIIYLIENEIKRSKRVNGEDENPYWEFDFEEYEHYIDVSKPLELLFNLSELLLMLNRLEMFNSLLKESEKSNKIQPQEVKNTITQQFNNLHTQIFSKNGFEIFSYLSRVRTFMHLCE